MQEKWVKQLKLSGKKMSNKHIKYIIIIFVKMQIKIVITTCMRLTQFKV